jgi:hypothetical protein
MWKLVRISGAARGKARFGWGEKPDWGGAMYRNTNAPQNPLSQLRSPLPEIAGLPRAFVRVQACL